MLLSLFVKLFLSDPLEALKVRRGYRKDCNIKAHLRSSNKIVGCVVFLFLFCLEQFSPYKLFCVRKIFGKEFVLVERRMWNHKFCRLILGYNITSTQEHTLHKIHHRRRAGILPNCCCCDAYYMFLMGCRKCK